MDLGEKAHICWIWIAMRDKYWYQKTGLTESRVSAYILLSHLSHVWLWDPIDCSLPGSSVHGISQQEYQSGLPFPTPVDLPDPRIESESPVLVGDWATTEPPGKSNSRLGRTAVLGILGKGLVYECGWGQLLIIAPFHSQMCPGWVKNPWSPYL